MPKVSSRESPPHQWWCILLGILSEADIPMSPRFSCHETAIPIVKPSVSFPATNDEWLGVLLEYRLRQRPGHRDHRLVHHLAQSEIE